jgi:hypothetical protein
MFMMRQRDLYLEGILWVPDKDLIEHVTEIKAIFLKKLFPF